MKPHTLGRFEGFPDIIQAYAELSYDFPSKKLQLLVVEALKDFNTHTETADLDTVTTVTPVICKYEIGIADGVYFNFLSQNEAEKFRKQLKGKIYKNLDFLVCVFYRYVRDNGKQVPLWSDFQYVRFNFEETGILKIEVHHFKGTRKLPLDILIRKIVDRINEKIGEKGLRPLQFIRLLGH
ncbi:hypothetical protein CW703_02385 [Candidatus Bathyarchaeota archaeon]|nr:MAG: hypothetical protein CW703_02385 [Candidatus Bathyarchaeota archaeon]